LTNAGCFKTFEHRLVVAGKVVIEPFTGIEFDQEKQIDETDFHLHATAVRCMLGKVFTLTLDKL
jgi:hypothetical protein